MSEKSSKKTVHAVILSAGMGTRMVSQKSKVLHQVSGVSMVEIVLNLARCVAQKITVITSHENNEKIQKILQNGEKTIIQEERLGTGHAVMVAKGEIESLNCESVLVLYADTPLVTIQTLKRIINTENDLTFLAFHENNTENKYGRLITNGEKLSKIVEFKDATPTERQIILCNSGVVCIKSNLLLKAFKKITPSPLTGEYYLTSLPEIVESYQGTSGYILCNKEEVMGVNSRVELAQVEEVMQNRIKENHMQNGVTFLLPHTTFVHLTAQIQQDVTIEPNCFIGNNVEIGKNTVIHSFSHLENCKIESNVEIGPFARIRPQTHLKNNVKIGNFVEVKASKIEEGVKINHLSYVGNATVGKQTNIGAGTVFCNYNGFSKFESTVGGSCFIGSNSTIISPVQIAEGTIIGAGSVITKSTEKNDLSISRTQQKNIPNGGEKFRKKCKK